MTGSTKIPTWFWIASSAALVWNLMGVMAFVAQMMMTPETLQQLPQAERDIYANTPVWANIAFACAVIGGALGSVALLIKKTWALYLFVLSFAGICTQMFHVFFISNSFEVFGPGGMIMPIMVVIVAVALIWLSKNAASNNWTS